MTEEHDHEDYYEALRRIGAWRPGIIHMQLAAAQHAWTSHGGTGPCPCWVCESRRSYLHSRGLPALECR